MTKEAVEKLIIKQVIEEFNNFLQNILSDPEKLAELAKTGFCVSLDNDVAEKAREILADDPEAINQIDFYMYLFNTVELQMYADELSSAEKFAEKYAGLLKRKMDR